MRRNRRIFIGGMAVLLCALLTLPQFAADYVGMTWTADGKVKLQVKRLGKSQDNATANLVFSGSTFEVRGDMNEVLLTGTYTADPKGKAELTPDPASLDNFLRSGVLEIVEDNGQKGTISSLQVTKQSMSAKCKSSSKGLQVSLKVNFKAEVFIDISSPEPTGLGTNLTFTANLKGTIPPDAATSKWVGNGKSKINIQGFGNENGQGTIELTFGSRDGVPMGFYSLYSVEDGYTLTGPFSQNGATVDMTGLAAAYANIIEAEAEAIAGVDVQVTVVSDRSEFKYKPSDSGKLNSKIQYTIFIPITGDSLKAKVTLSGKLDSA